MVYLHSGILLNYENDKFMKILGKWMELETVIQSEVSPITKEHTWYVLTDMWILAPKLRIPKIQLTDHLKLKKKEDQSVGGLVLLRKGTIYTQGKLWRQCQAEIEGKATDRLYYLVIHPINSHQPLTLL